VDRLCVSLLSTEAGEGVFVVDSDTWTITAAGATTTSTATELAAISSTVSTAATATATTELTTIATEVATITTVSTVRTLSALTTKVSTLTATTTATATATAASLSWLLLERVVNVEEVLLRRTLALTSGLLFSLEVVVVLLLGQLFGRLPLLVLLGALIWSTSFLQTKFFKLLSGLLSQVVGIRLAVVLGLLFARWSRLTTLGCRYCLSILVPNWVRTSIPTTFLLLLFGNGLASFLVSEFAISGGFTPTVSLLLGMFATKISRERSTCKHENSRNAGTVDMSITTSAGSVTTTATSSSTNSALCATWFVSKTISTFTFGRLIAVVGSASGAVTECCRNRQIYGCFECYVPNPYLLHFH